MAHTPINVVTDPTDAIPWTMRTADGQKVFLLENGAYLSRSHRRNGGGSAKRGGGAKRGSGSDANAAELTASTAEFHLVRASDFKSPAAAAAAPATAAAARKKAPLHAIRKAPSGDDWVLLSPVSTGPKAF